MQTCWSGNVPTEMADSPSTPWAFLWREKWGKMICGWKISEGVSYKQNTSDDFYMTMFICLEKYSYKGLSCFLFNYIVDLLFKCSVTLQFPILVAGLF